MDMPGLLRTIVIIEGGQSLGVGFVYGDSYGEEKKNNTANIFPAIAEPIASQFAA
jgi:hypothetical protein